MPDLGGSKGRKREMSKQSMREETERLVKEAIAPNRVLAAPGQVRVAYTCKECGDKQKTL
jgi:hypothetical protein